MREAVAAMAPKSPVGPAHLRPVYHVVYGGQKEWPKGTAFHEESGAYAQASTYRACAREFAKQVARDERPSYRKAVAGEATKRVLGLHLFKKQERDLLVGYPIATRCRRRGWAVRPSRQLLPTASALTLEAT